jgi:hypothetical protein
MGGGGDGGYEARQAQVEADKSKARTSLNRMFGEGGFDEHAYLSANPDVAAQVGPGGFESGQQHYDKFGRRENRQIQADPAALAAKAARESMYQTVRDNAFTSGKRRLDENADDARRKLKFELFASGQAGGSGDVDQNARLNRTYSQGLIDLGGKADAAKAEFRGNDEDTRLQLLQSIDNGMDQGSALSQASQRMQIASDRAASDAQGTALGNLFDSAGLMYTDSQLARGRQAGQQAAFDMFPQQGASRRGQTTGGNVFRSNAYGD